MIRKYTASEVSVVLGVHTGHDAGAAVVRDGRLVACVNEERLNRKKLFWGWPERAVAEALRLAGVEPAAVDRVAVAGTSGSAKEFGAERPTFLKRALQRGVADLMFERACQAYRDGEATLSRAAEIAGVTLRDMMLKMQGADLDLNYGVES